MSSTPPAEPPIINYLRFRCNAVHQPQATEFFTWLNQIITGLKNQTTSTREEAFSNYKLQGSSFARLFEKLHQPIASLETPSANKLQTLTAELMEDQREQPRESLTDYDRKFIPIVKHIIANQVSSFKSSYKTLMGKAQEIKDKLLTRGQEDLPDGISSQEIATDEISWFYNPIPVQPVDTEARLSEYLDQADIPGALDFILDVEEAGQSSLKLKQMVAERAAEFTDKLCELLMDTRDFDLDPDITVSTDPTIAMSTCSDDYTDIITEIYFHSPIENVYALMDKLLTVDNKYTSAGYNLCSAITAMLFPESKISYDDLIADLKEAIINYKTIESYHHDMDVEEVRGNIYAHMAAIIIKGDPSKAAELKLLIDEQAAADNVCAKTCQDLLK